MNSSKALDNPFCSQFDGNIGESGKCVMESDDNDTDCGRFDIYSSEKTLNRSGNGMIFDLKYRYLTAHSIISVLKRH